jgi:hypothetical protein
MVRPHTKNGLLQDVKNIIIEANGEPNDGKTKNNMAGLCVK